MAVLTDKQETFLGPIGITGMSAHRASLARIMGIYLDRHRTVQEGFISNHAVQFGKRPLGVGGICFSLLAACFLAFLAFRSLSDVFQLFQADQHMGVSSDDAFGNDMIGVTHISSFHAVFAKVLHVLLQKGEYSLEQPIQLALS